MNQIANILGELVGFTTLRFTLLGLTLETCQAFTVTGTAANELKHGSKGRKPIGYGRGYHSYEGSMSLFYEEQMLLRDAIRAFTPNGSLLDCPPLDVVLSVIQEGTPSPAKGRTCVVKILIGNDAFNASGGDTALTKEISFLVLGEPKWLAAA